MDIEVRFSPLIHFDHVTLSQDISLTTYFPKGPVTLCNAACREGAIGVWFFKERNDRKPSLSVTVDFGPDRTIEVIQDSSGKYQAIVGFFQKM